MNAPKNIPFLKPGDEIRIVAPASVVEKEYITNTVEALQGLGYRVSLGKHVLSVFNQFAGTDQQRRTDFQQALEIYDSL